MESRYTIPGMSDVLPKQHDYFTFIKKVVRHHARRSGYKRISLPGLIKLETLEIMLGKASTVFQKELFIVDIDGVQYAMRPDSTTGTIRAYVENELESLPAPQEFYYIDQAWRKMDRHGKKMYQTHQFGFEIIGEEDPALDAQLIAMCVHIFEDVGMSDVRVIINNCGTKASQEKYNEDLRNFFAGKERSLTTEDQQKLELSPMRLLSSIEEDTQILAKIAPTITRSLDNESKEHHKKVKDYLDVLGIAFEEDERMFLDADMYTHTVFRFEAEFEGARIVLGGGGRYNNVISELGVKRILPEGAPASAQTIVSAPAVGASVMMEKVEKFMEDIHLSVPSKDKLDVFIVQLGDDAKKVAIKLAADLRARGVKTMGALGKAAIRSQLETAGRFEVKYSLVIGQMEVLEKKIIIRDMKKGTQETISFDGIIDRMVELLDPSTLDVKDYRSMIE